MDEHVLDASAALAATFKEPGWPAVQQVGERLISSVNYAESISTMTEKGYTVEDAVESLGFLAMWVVEFDEAQAIEAARLRPLTRGFGLSLGDRACLALAGLRGLPVLTADRAWVEAAPHLAITCIR